MQNLLSLHELVKARLHCRAMHEGSDPTATLILRLIVSNHAITRLLVPSIPWILEWDSCNCLSSIAWRGLLICAHVHLSLFCVLLTLWRICHSPSTNHVCIIGRANESCMHLFLRIQTLAQILGYRLFSLTYSNICLMARPEDLVLYKVMPTRDIVKCSSINMTNARLISSRKHKLPSQRVAYLRQTTGAKKHREYISIYSYTIVSVDTSVRSIH